MLLQKGQIVFSRRGRDCGRAYMVCGLDLEGERVLLANGDKWTLARPKPKNVRHINPTTAVLPPGDRTDDHTLKGALGSYCVSISPTSGG